MALLNYTIEADADKTAGEISKMLAKAGATAVMTEYDPDGGYVTSLSFKLSVKGTIIGFKLPADWKPVLEVLRQQSEKTRSQGKRFRGSVNQEQAVRVAWRIIKDWTEAQLALIETHMVTTEQVFLPYAVMKGGQTLYEKMVDSKFLLGEGK